MGVGNAPRLALFLHKQAYTYCMILRHFFGGIHLRVR